MENHRPESTDEQIEHHSLPGTNMAGKGPGDECDRPDEHDENDAEGSRKNRAERDRQSEP